ncbi:hypothetical protein S40288_10151 [Stachybotrys chartarum IBT 40288]|nr:hypothetical protein S40288_10151 [Stachybotrys chartarum IBT 40288]
MLLNHLTLTAFIANVAAAAAQSTYLNWRSFRANGVNLGGWLHQEAVIDPAWWNQHAPGTLDEWDFCVAAGRLCGPVLEQRYASYITTTDIDILARAGINVLRIPTGYNAWVAVPGSRLYTGNQSRHLRTISEYAITRYGMHIILDIHSHPGGVNGMGLGGREGGYDWFNNQTALSYSNRAVDAAIAFIQGSSRPDSWTLEPLNEPVDNRDPSSMGSPAALSDAGAAWVLSYFRGVISRVNAVNSRIPVMLQGSFRPVEFWSPNFPTNANIVFDIHHYYFAGRPTTSANIPEWICRDAIETQGDGRFPAFVGEWSIQATSANTFASRARNLNTGLRTFSQYFVGSAYWTYKFFGDVPVDGQGTQGDYWNYSDFISMAIINPSSGVACS